VLELGGDNGISVSGFLKVISLVQFQIDSLIRTKLKTIRIKSMYVFLRLYIVHNRDKNIKNVEKLLTILVYILKIKLQVTKS